MKTIKGPAIFLAQFIKEEAPYNSLEGLADWTSGMGYKGIQIPTLDPAFFDLQLAADSQTYCDELSGMLADRNLEITELSTHLQGQMLAVHPAYNLLQDSFAPASVRGKHEARTEWARSQLLLAAKASRNLGLPTHATFSGSLAWPYFYPWPPRPDGLIEEAFEELARRWHPILNAFDEAGVDVCYEIHPGEDLFDGATFEKFLSAVDDHPRCNILFDPSHLLLQGLDYLEFLDIYKDRIRAFHVKDAEFNPTGRQGVYSGYASWKDRAARFRSPGDGQVDFRGIFSKLAMNGYDGWAVLEWECCLKDSGAGAREGKQFIENHIIQVTEQSFDNFARRKRDSALNKVILGVTDA